LTPATLATATLTTTAATLTTTAATLTTTAATLTTTAATLVAVAVVGDSPAAALTVTVSALASATTTPATRSTIIITAAKTTGAARATGRTAKTHLGADFLRSLVELVRESFDLSLLLLGSLQLSLDARIRREAEQTVKTTAEATGATEATGASTAAAARAASAPAGTLTSTACRRLLLRQGAESECRERNERRRCDEG
jgi:hypothetical protein